MTYPVNIRGDERRFWDLAEGAKPTDFRESDLIATAAVINPHAWAHNASVWARFRSLDAASRVLRWVDVWRPLPVAPTAPPARKSFFARFQRRAAA